MSSNPIEPEVLLTPRVFIEWVRDNIAFYRKRELTVELICLPVPLEPMIDKAYLLGDLAGLVTHAPLNGSLRTYLDGIKVRFIKSMDITRSLWVVKNLNEKEPS